MRRAEIAIRRLRPKTVGSSETQNDEIIAAHSFNRFKGIFMIGRTQLAVVEEHSAETAENENQTNVAPTLEATVDEAAIRKIVDAIDASVDAKNWQLCRSYFADEIAVDFTSLAGGAPARITADELINGWRANLYADKKSFHQRTNHQIEIGGDAARVVSKGYAFNLLEAGEAAGMWEVWGDYAHTLTRTETGWLVTGMSLTVAHTRGDDRVRTFVPTQE